MADTNTIPRPGIFSPGVLIGGGLAGVLGGILMGVAETLYGASTVMGASTPWQAIAGTFYGPMAFVGASGATAIGVLLQLAVSGGFGVLFAALAVNARSAGKLFFAGILYGIAVWAFMTYVIIPVFDATMGARIPMIATMWFFLHWIYGAFTGLFTPPLRRAFAETTQVGAPSQVQEMPTSRRAA